MIVYTQINEPNNLKEGEIWLPCLETSPTEHRQSWKQPLLITHIDAKTKLQEFSLKRFKRLPIYKIISNTGPRHKPVFRVAVKLQSTKFYNGEGKSKKEAEQNAALLCLNDNLI